MRKIPVISKDRIPLFLKNFREDASNISLLFFLIVRIISYLYCFTKCRNLISCRGLIYQTPIEFILLFDRKN
ncbi:hypothetical protein ES703_73108 [subsurface metagenome]